MNSLISVASRRTPLPPVPGGEPKPRPDPEPQPGSAPDVVPPVNPDPEPGSTPDVVRLKIEMLGRGVTDLPLASGCGSCTQTERRLVSQGSGGHESLDCPNRTDEISCTVAMAQLSVASRRKSASNTARPLVRRSQTSGWQSKGVGAES